MTAESPNTPVLDHDVVLWSADESARAGRPLLVLLHGYGSHEGDLFGLVPYLPDGFAYAAVRAPLAPPWPTPGHSWYPIEGLDGRDPAHVTAAASASDPAHSKEVVLLQAQLANSSCEGKSGACQCVQSTGLPSI